MLMIEKWDQWDTMIFELINHYIEKFDKHEWTVLECDITWLTPLKYPRKLVCVGVNYTDHIKEMNLEALPPRPYTFLKPTTTTLVASDSIVEIPKQAKQVDWEAELAVIIGRNAKGVKGNEALNCIWGFSILNDISARDWLSEPSLVGVDWVIQKAFDGFTPVGPYITPKTFVEDPQDLEISLSVNDVVKQNSNTAKMLFSIQEIIEHLSSIITLEPGDVIATGTPAGVEHGRANPDYLKSGDIMKVNIDGLGELVTKMI